MIFSIYTYVHYFPVLGFPTPLFCSTILLPTSLSLLRSHILLMGGASKMAAVLTMYSISRCSGACMYVRMRTVTHGLCVQVHVYACAYVYIWVYGFLDTFVLGFICPVSCAICGLWTCACIGHGPTCACSWYAHFFLLINIFFINEQVVLLYPYNSLCISMPLRLSLSSHDIIIPIVAPITLYL